MKIGDIELKDWEIRNNAFFVRSSLEWISTELHLYRLYPLTHYNNWRCRFYGSLSYLAPIFRVKYKRLLGDENEVKSIVDAFLIKMNNLIVFV